MEEWAMPSLPSRLFPVCAVLAVSFLGVARAEDLPRPDAKAAGLFPEKLERLDALLQDAVEYKQIAGGVVLLARHGKIGHVKVAGWRDAEAKTAMTADTLFRIASMTKPITSVAVMLLVEDGKLRLNDPVSKYIPEFKEPKVLVPGADKDSSTLKPAGREITIHDLLAHTSGLTYRFWGVKPWAALYRDGGVGDGLVHPRGTCADNIRRLAKQPLQFQPGSAWVYGLSTDVLGVVVEKASGQDLATFFRERIFGPLKMTDTFFFVPEAKKDRLAALYLLGADRKLTRVGEEPVTLGDLVFSARYPCEKEGRYFSGGAGLVSTARDYTRFLQMLLNRGELDGVRLLKPETVQRMTRNQIGDISIYIKEHGDCFGYGFGVVTEAGQRGGPASVGSYSWGGIFHTYFWVDPKKELIGVLMTQVYVVGELPLRHELQKRAYECLAD
jgi:CubicO group peptidase (beta-lactamase class C family)